MKAQTKPKQKPAAAVIAERNAVDFRSIFPGVGWSFPTDFTLDLSGILPNRIAIHYETDTVVLLCMQSMNGPDFFISCAGLRWMYDQNSVKAYRNLMAALTTDGMDTLFNCKRADEAFWDLRNIPPMIGKAMSSGASRLAQSDLHQGYGACWMVAENFSPVGTRHKFGWRR
jgi:hypothetical protein